VDLQSSQNGHLCRGRGNSCSAFGLGVPSDLSKLLYRNNLLKAGFGHWLAIEGLGQSTWHTQLKTHRRSSGALPSFRRMLLNRLWSKFAIAVARSSWSVQDSAMIAVQAANQ